MREVGRQVVGDPVGEIVLLLVAGEVLERQHDDGKPRRVGELVLRHRSHEARGEARPPPIGADREQRGDENGGGRRVEP